MITSVPPIVLRSCRDCGLDELAASRVLFLREQVRDLRVREFLKELVVGVAVPGDLVGSIIVEILHSCKDEDVEQVARTSKQISHICGCLSISLSPVFTSCMLISFTSFICLIFTCA